MEDCLNIMLSNEFIQIETSSGIVSTFIPYYCYLFAGYFSAIIIVLFSARNTILDVEKPACLNIAIWLSTVKGISK